MSEYQIVPYSFYIHVSGKPGERRPLDNVDAAGMSAIDFLAKAATAHTGVPRLETADASTAMQIDQVARGQHVVTVTASSGQRGVMAQVIQRRDGKLSKTDIIEADWTHTHLRNVFFVPPGSTAGVALVERVGNAGVVTKLQKMYGASLRARYPDLLFSMVPAMSPAAIEAWAKDAQVKSIVLRHTHTTTGESATKLGGLPFGQIIEFRAPRNRWWSSKLFGGKLDKAAQKRILTEVVPQMPGVSVDDAESKALEMMDQGWEVALGLQKGTRRRLVKVSTQASITMTFPAVIEGSGARRPSHEEFVDACQSALTEMSDDAMSVGQPKLCSWDDEPWKDDDQPWKAVWGVPESDATGGSS